MGFSFVPRSSKRASTSLPLMTATAAVAVAVVGATAAFSSINSASSRTIEQRAANIDCVTVASTKECGI